MSRTLSYFTTTVIRPKKYSINIASTISDDIYVENISNINGLAIPALFQFKKNKTMYVFNPNCSSFNGQGL